MIQNQTIKKTYIKKGYNMNSAFPKGHKMSCGKNNPSWKGGISSRKAYCKECGKLLSYCSYDYCARCRQAGERNNNWQGGISPLENRIRHCFEYKQWREALFARDNYTCQECGAKENIETHHKKAFIILYKEFLKEYDQFSPFEDQDTLLRLAMKWQPFWDIDKGITLCEDCHNLTKQRKD